MKRIFFAFAFVVLGFANAQKPIIKNYPKFDECKDTPISEEESCFRSQFQKTLYTNHNEPDAVSNSASRSNFSATTTSTGKTMSTPSCFALSKYSEAVWI